MSDVTEDVETRAHDGTYETAREICKWFGPEAGYDYRASDSAWCVVIEVITDGEARYDWYGADTEISRPANKTFELSDVRREDLNRLTMKQVMASVDAQAI